MKKQCREPPSAEAPGPDHVDAVSALLEQTAVELEKRKEGRSSSQTLEGSWTYEEEASENEAVAEEEEREEEEGEEDVFSEKVSPEAEECPALKVK